MKKFDSIKKKLAELNAVLKNISDKAKQLFEKKKTGELIKITVKRFSPEPGIKY